jgi:hypothetical protein
MIYLTSILFTLLFVYYSKYQFQDQRKRNFEWKKFGASMRVLFFVSCFLVQFFQSDWKDYLLAGSINILLFEIGINVIALQMPIFYNGTTGVLDKKLKSTKWYLMFVLLILSIILKIFL